MPDNTVTLALEGDVTLFELRESVNRFANLVDLLSREIAPEVHIQWTVEDLQGGSALMTVVGEAEDEEPVLRVVKGYERVGQSLQRGEPAPFSPAIQREAISITRMVKDNIISVRFHTAEVDTVIYGEAVALEKRPEMLVSFGAVRGRVQTLSSRGKLKFTLYDLFTDKPVTCYLQEEQRDQMIKAWGHEVVVMGRVTRSPEAGRPLTVREITQVEPLRNVDAQSYRALRGSIPWNEDDERSEITIRRMRDADDEIYLRR